MSIESVIGLDHVVVIVRDLDAAAAAWQKLGFTISPRGVHSAHMGTANHTLMLGEDYLELMGIVAPTERNAPTRALLEKREGIERAAFTTTDAAAGVAALRARGLQEAIGPTDFSRPVELADGTKTEAKFATFQWPLDERPGGLRIFACQHFTRAAVWLPELQRHANGAHRIDHVEMLSTDPATAAAHMSRLIDMPVETEDDGAKRVETGAGRGAFVFVNRAMLEARHPGVSLAGLPDEGAVVLALRVEDADQTAKALGVLGRATEPGVVKVAPQDANGVLIVFAEG
jgi:catechol 2,3-dioxygenase-like lactoylglutathione lyase family enzyme